MSPDHPQLAEDDVIAGGGWHRSYARILAVASDGDYGFALVDGNGDGAELESETWIWQAGVWAGAASAGEGPLDTLGRVQTGGPVGNAYFAFGKAPAGQTIMIDFDHRLHPVQVSRYGIWAFMKSAASPGQCGPPAPA